MNGTYIICSAIHYDNNQQYMHQPKNVETGMVICGRRHHNIFPILVGLFGKNRFKNANETQGFLTADDRFVDRKTALTMARSNNQILDERTVYGGNLCSENLY